MGLEKALVNVFDGSDELAEGLANAVVMASLEAVKERGRFTIAVTSGQSLEILASILTAEPFLSSLDWTKWNVFFVDERCAPITSPCSCYKMIDKLLLKKVRIPEMQVFPAYNHSMRLDKSGHLCEPCASLYEDQMRAVLGGGAGLPSLDVVLLGLDSQGNSASFIKGHPIVSNEIHNYEVSWGAEGKTRPLRPNQVVTAMYECGEEIVDCELSAADLLLLKNRFPKERISLTLPMVNNAQDVFIVARGTLVAPVLQQFFEKMPDETIPLYHLKGMSGRPKMFLDKEAVSSLAYPQSLRNFQISDLTFHFNAAREASIEAESKDAQSIDSEPVSQGSQLPPSLEERMAQMRSRFSRTKVKEVDFDDIPNSPTSPLAENDPLEGPTSGGDRWSALESEHGATRRDANVLAVDTEEAVKRVDDDDDVWEKDQVDGCFKRVESAGMRGGGEGSEIVVKRVPSNSKDSLVAATGEMTGKIGKASLMDTETDLLPQILQGYGDGAGEQGGGDSMMRMQGLRSGGGGIDSEEEETGGGEGSSSPARGLDHSSLSLQRNGSGSGSLSQSGESSSMPGSKNGPGQLSEEDMSPDGCVIVPDDTSDFSEAVSMATNGRDDGKRGKVFVRPGVYGWNGEIVVQDASLEIRGRDGAVLCGKLKFLDGSKGSISGVTICLFSAGISDTCLKFSSFDEPSEWSLVAVRVLCVGGTCVDVGGITSLQIDSCTIGGGLLEGDAFWGDSPLAPPNLDVAAWQGARGKLEAVVSGQRTRVAQSSRDGSAGQMEGISRFGIQAWNDCEVKIGHSRMGGAGCLTCLAVYDEADISCERVVVEQTNRFAVSLRDDASISLFECSVMCGHGASTRTGSGEGQERPVGGATVWAGAMNGATFKTERSFFTCETKDDLWGGDEFPLHRDIDFDSVFAITQEATEQDFGALHASRSAEEDGSSAGGGSPFPGVARGRAAASKNSRDLPLNSSSSVSFVRD